MSKILSSIALAGVIALSLAACTAGGGSDADTVSAKCDPTASGASSDKVKATGDFGSQPKVTFTAPLASTATERTVTIKGSGKPAQDGDAVSIYYTVFNGTTGKQIETTGYKKASAVDLSVSSATLIPGLYGALHCATPGTRVSAVIPPADAFGTTGSEALGLGATDSIVFSIDVISVKSVLSKANGADQPAPKDFPTVTLAADGAPTITVPKTDPPTKTKIADLKKGTGATVKSGDTVTVQYTGVLWKDGTIFDSSWTKGSPATFSTDGVIKGFGQALVGQKVGSQVIAIIPPADGYGDAGSGAITGTDTIVFVVDILAVTK